MKTTCSRGKHSAKKRLNKKKVVCLFILLIVFAFFVIEILKNGEDQNVENLSSENIENIVNEEQTNEITKTFEKVDMPNKIENYNVIGQLVIEKIDLKKYILNKTTTTSLNLSVTKLYGPEVNGQGNFCIVGHNSKGLFIKLKKLLEGDKFYVISKGTGEKVEYEIYKKYTVVPTNLDCLKQNTGEKREVTLITCNPRRVDQTYTQSEGGIEGTSKVQRK